MKRALTLLLSLLMLVSVSASFAQVSVVPQLMNFQGRLARPDGTPVADNTYSVRFSLHSALTGGMETWNQTIASVAVRNGTFAVQLSSFPAGTFNTSQWLEIKIGTDAPLTPRQPLITVPYAFKADMALTVPDGSITNAKIAPGTITADKFAPSFLTAGGDLTGTYPNPLLATLASSLFKVSGGNMQVLPGSAVTLDQQQTSGPSQLTIPAGTDVTVWQSFKPGASGSLPRIDLSCGSPSSRILQFLVYAGEGVSGTLLTSFFVNLGPNVNFKSLLFPSPVNVVGGQTYTLVIRGQDFILGQDTANPYPNGRSNAGAGTDFAFKTYLGGNPTISSIPLSVLSTNEVPALIGISNVTEANSGAVTGIAIGGSGNGVVGESRYGAGVVGMTTDGYAGQFYGRVSITGSNGLGDLHIAASSTSTYGASLLLDASAATGGNNWLLLSTANQAGEGQGKLVFRNFANGAYGITQDASGNVGIRTTDPAGNALNVAGTAQMTGFKLPTGATAGAVLTSDASGAGSWVSSASLFGTPSAATTYNIWSLNGNSATNPATHFLGTTDNQPLVVKVNNRRAMQYSYGESSVGRSINVLGGSEINIIGAGVIGATIAGGGFHYFTGTVNPNQVLEDFGTVGGGASNTASQNSATVAGGNTNTASGIAATVSGGAGNTASQNSATVAGGNTNTASGLAATVAGGAGNTALGDYSFAAGRRAKANHDNAFVWADGTAAEFASTGDKQFLIRASGGVGINTNSPQAPLHLLDSRASAWPSLRMDANSDIGTWLQINNLAEGGRSWNLISTGSANEEGAGRLLIRDQTSFVNRLVIDPTGNIGVGTHTPAQKLDVNGTAQMTGFKLPTGATAGRALLSDAAGVGTWGQVDSPGIAPAAITTNKIADGAVTADKLAPGALNFWSLDGNAGTATATDFLGTTDNKGLNFRTNNVERLRITNTGDVGIGTTAPAYKLHVNGQVAGVGAYVNASDARYKQNIATFPNALDAILNLRGVTFDWKQADFPDMNFTPGKQIGFIAQEVEKVLPELVSTDSKGYKSVAYANVVPVLVEAVKTQNKQVETLSKDNAELKAKNAELEARLERLEAALLRVQK